MRYGYYATKHIDMNKLSLEEQVLVQLVRKEPIGALLPGCMPEKLLTNAKEHKILLPLANGIKDDSISDEYWRTWAQKTCFAAEAEGRIRAATTRKTIAILESIGIKPILLKGTSISLGNLRDSGDVDLLIPRTSLHDAISALEAAGYVYQGFLRNQHIKAGEYRRWERLQRWSIQFEFSEPSTGILFELHTAFFDTGRLYDEDFSDLRFAIDEFASACATDRDTGNIYLALEDRVFLLSLHAGVKRAPSREGFILRHILDLQALCDAGLDWAKVERRSFQHEKAHHLLLLLSLYELITGSRRLEAIGRGVAARLPARCIRLVHLHMACLVGINEYSRSAIFRYRLTSSFVIRSRPIARVRALLVLPLILPDPIKMRSIYRLPQRSRQVYFFYFLEPLRALKHLLERILSRR
jgi:hypothetical protein